MRTLKSTPLALTVAHLDLTSSGVAGTRLMLQRSDRRLIEIDEARESGRP
jgi:hypothetical protein